MTATQPNWQPTTMIPMFVEMAQGMLDSGKDQLANMQQAQHKPYVLDDATVDRVMRAYTEQKSYLPLYVEQCQRWEKENLSQQECEQATTVKDCITQLAPIVDTILRIAQSCKGGTLEQMLGKDDMTLAQDMLIKND